MKNIRFVFILKLSGFWWCNFSIYLNRCVLVMFAVVAAVVSFLCVLFVVMINVIIKSPLT